MHNKKVCFLKSFWYSHDNKHGKNNDVYFQEIERLLLASSLVAWPEEIEQKSVVKVSELHIKVCKQFKKEKKKKDLFRF